MARWIMFTDNVFWKYSWAHVVISITVAFLYVMQCRLSARRSRASSMVFRPWPLRTEIVPDSLNLWMILCTVDDNNFTLCYFYLRNSFLILLHYFSTQHWGNWWSSSHLDFWETLPLQIAYSCSVWASVLYCPVLYWYSNVLYCCIIEAWCIKYSTQQKHMHIFLKIFSKVQ